MRRELLHIYGPFSINSYGLLIVLGLVITTFLMGRDPLRKRLLSMEQLVNTITVAVLAGVIGGRLLFVFSNWNIFESVLDIFALWDGGFSLLGSILGICLALPPYVYWHGIPMVPFLDLAACYAPLMQGISRVGCFFAGCCCGTATSLPWAITYTNTDSLAPLGVPLHPAQLYSCLALISIFFILRYVVRPHVRIPGQLTLAYLMLTSIERFSLDFLRQDREFLPNMNVLSLHQVIAAAIVCVTLALFIFRTTKKQHIHEPI